MTGATLQLLLSDFATVDIRCLSPKPFDLVLEPPSMNKNVAKPFREKVERLVRKSMHFFF